MSFTFKLLSLKIKALLDDHGLMIKDVADKNGIKPPALSQFLKNGTGLSMDKVELICNYFGIKSIDIPEVKTQEVFKVKETKKINEVMYSHLIQSLGENGWNIQKTAGALGMGRWKLYKEMKSFNIVRPK